VFARVCSSARARACLQSPGPPILKQKVVPEKVRISRISHRVMCISMYHFVMTCFQKQLKLIFLSLAF
jgi:hypothetical protein